MKLDSLHKLLVMQLKDLYSAEKQLLEALPKMEKAERNALRQRMHELYANHYSALNDTKEQDGDEPEAEDVAVSPEASPESSSSKKKDDSTSPKEPPGHIDTDAGDQW